jgi:deoxyribodipyrimidine photo-lyase
MAAKQAELRASQLGVSTQGAAAWLNELIWREFYISILFHFPYVSNKAFNPKYQNIQWRNNIAEFGAWKVGRTGMPIVDAAMRQLLATGWMHNRARMIVASFLVKDLLINWQWGERWFFETLLDGDPAANNGGWQWTAGTGTDAAPFFRVFNPILQAQKFDPNGDYVRRWVPELVDVPESYLQTPWKMPVETQQKCDCLIGIDYPDLIVDHDEARKRVLRVYKES